MKLLWKVHFSGVISHIPVSGQSPVCRLLRRAHLLPGHPTFGAILLFDCYNVASPSSIKHTHWCPMDCSYSSKYHQFSRMLSRWFRVVALFMVTFVLFDVCIPEPCSAQTTAPVQSVSQIHLQAELHWPISQREFGFPA